MPRPRLGDRGSQRLRRQAIHRACRRKRARLDADHLPVGRARRRVVGFRGQHRGARGGQARFRLRHVGARHFADVEAVAGLAELLLQHLDVAALQLQDRRIADQVHVRRGGVEQHGLLGQPQRLARRRHQLLGLPGAARGAQAVEQRLRDGSAVALQGDGAGRSLAVGGAVPAALVVLVMRVQILLADVCREVGARAIAGQRLRNGFVGGADRGALGVELRIVLVGLGQRPGQRVGGCRAASKHHNRGTGGKPAHATPRYRR